MLFSNHDGSLLRCPLGAADKIALWQQEEDEETERDDTEEEDCREAFKLARVAQRVIDYTPISCI